jgi:hypothetical protein
MTVDRSTGRLYIAAFVLLAGILILGIVQWSFLPILIQNAPGATRALLEFSPSHTSKFAAPFKAFHGDGPVPVLVRARIVFRPAMSAVFLSTDAPLSGVYALVLTQHPLRAPPSA